MNIVFYIKKVNIWRSVPRLKSWVGSTSLTHDFNRGVYAKIFLIFFLFFSVQISAQDSLLVSKNFLFKDGIYLKLESLQQNSPDHKWEDVDARYFANPQTFLTSVDYIKGKSQNTDNQYFDLNKIWGICIDGIPYIRIPDTLLDKKMTTFVALKVRGKICYFTYNYSKKVTFPMSAYNPVNGKPFRTGMIEREMEFKAEKMMIFETGEIEDFTLENFRKRILDDPRLIQSINELTEQEANEKLFKCLLIYDDRNEIFVPGKIEDARR